MSEFLDVLGTIIYHRLGTLIHTPIHGYHNLFLTTLYMSCSPTKVPISTWIDLKNLTYTYTIEYFGLQRLSNEPTN